ncbi:MAG: CusA/CzcA family heavy metal efflux RND transporter [Ignavibacteria bacterium]|nr:CusA/CzcA family heavy metal efflux RND transporter [Ignavibacteria bacterium]
MFERIITFSVRNRLIVAVGVIGLVVWGIVSLNSLPIDAVPDITNNQVQVVTVSPALAPQEVERLITMPVELTMASIPGISEMRSISRFGLSVVTIVFHDDVDVYWARAQVDQRLTEVMDQIPQGAGTPLLAPVTTGLGEIYQYSLRVKPGYESRYSLTELRTIQDWIIRRRLLGTAGIADVSSFGGNLKQVEIAVDPDRLRSMNISISELLSAVQRNNANAGGAYIEKGPHVQYIRTEGVTTSPDEVGEIEVHRTDAGLPIYVHDVATVREGRAVRYGAMTRDDRGETVGGIVLMLKGANSSEVISTVKERMKAVQKTLPEGLVIEPYLDRTRLVNKAIGTVSQNLIEGALIVIFVLVLMLGNLRAGLIVASVIPLAMLFAVSMMRVFGVSGNLMSLGAIDFGLIVDGAVIIVESVLHALSKKNATEDSARVASITIRRSAAFGEIIIMIVYLPILALVGIEGKMFKPMAQTVIFAIIGAFILSTTYVPMMSSWLLKPGIKTWSLADKVMDIISRSYVPVRRLALRLKWFTLSSTLVVFVAAVIAFLMMGGEFLPQLDEGDFAVEMRLMTGSSLTETIRTSEAAAKILLREFPEVVRVIGKIGTSEIPLDPMPMESGDVMIILKDKDEWTSASTREELVEKMQSALSVIPGVTFGFQQPIQMRFNELMTGARQDVVVKVFGENMDTLAVIAQRLGAIAGGVQGAADIYVEPVNGLPQITVRIDRAACARLGVDVDDVNTTVRAAFAGSVAGVMYEGEKRFDIVVRLDSARRHDPSDVASLFVPTRTKQLVPITQIASVDIALGPNQIQREDAQRRIAVGFNVRGRDVESIVKELEEKVQQRLTLPTEYYMTYGGQFENLAAAKERLMIAVPTAMLLILFLLYMTFQSIRNALLIFTAIPLSAIGGIAALLLRGMPFSISAGVGFIALFGVAVLNGIVLISAFQKLHEKGNFNMLRVVIIGTSERLRPVAMTAMVASLGFLPMAISQGDGSEVQRPLATVVIGGLITSTMLTLLLLPTLYSMFGHARHVDGRTHRKHKRGHHFAAATSIALLVCLGWPSTISAQSPVAITLDSAMKAALNANIDLRTARAEEGQADALRGAAIDLGPTSVTYMGGQYNSASSDNNFTIMQSVPFPTKMIASRSLADETYREAQLRRSVGEHRIRLDVRRVYAMICMNREIDAILKEQESYLDKAVEVATLREQAGEGTMLERVNAESQRAEIGVQRLASQSNIRTAEMELRVLVGSAVPITASATTIPVLPIPGSADTVIASPLIDLANQRIRVADEAKSVASSGYWPDITLGYFNQSLNGTLLPDQNRLAGSGDRFSGFTVGLALPLWFVPTSAKTEAASIQRTLAEQRAAQEITTLSAWRQQIDVDLKAARAAVEYYANTGLAEAQLLVRHSQAAYQAGEIGWLELQASLLQSLQTRTYDVQARRRLYDLIIQHDYLMGQTR